MVSIIKNIIISFIAYLNVHVKELPMYIANYSVVNIVIVLMVFLENTIS